MDRKWQILEMYARVSLSIVLIQARGTKNLKSANAHVNEKQMAGIRGTLWAQPTRIPVSQNVEDGENEKLKWPQDFQPGDRRMLIVITKREDLGKGRGLEKGYI